MQGLVSDLAANDELAQAFRNHVVKARRVEVQRVIDRGVARGDLRPDADYDLAPELLVGPVYYRLLLSGAPLPRNLADRIVASVLSCFAAPAEHAARRPARESHRGRSDSGRRS